MNGNTTPEKEVDSMFKHEKMLFHPVAVEKPNPQYAEYEHDPAVFRENRGR